MPIRLLPLIVTITVALFAYGLRADEARSISSEMISIDRLVAALPKPGSAIESKTLSDISSHVSSLLHSQPPAPKGKAPRLFVSSFQVIQAAQLEDSAKKKWTVVVCGGGEQLSTLAWPVGSTDDQAIVSSFSCSIAHKLDASRITLPATQPASGGKSIRINIVVDGVVQRVSISVDPKGSGLGEVQGWQTKDVTGTKMIWGEVGRYGFRNVDVSIAPLLALPIAEHVLAIHFIPDGRLAVASADVIELVDPRDGSRKDAVRLSNLNRYINKIRFSPDGQRIAMNGSANAPPLVVDFLKKREHNLSKGTGGTISANDFVFQTSDSALVIEHYHIARTNFTDDRLESFDLISDHEGAMEMAPADATRNLSGNESFPMVSASPHRIAISHTAGVFVFDDGKPQGRYLGPQSKFGQGHLSLSSDGQLLVTQDGFGDLRITDLRLNKPVFEAEGNRGDGANAPWSDDSRLVAFAPATRIVLCQLNPRKLAVRMLLPVIQNGDSFEGAFALTRDGQMLAIADNIAKKVMLWRTADVIAAARDQIKKDSAATN